MKKVRCIYAFVCVKDPEYACGARFPHDPDQCEPCPFRESAHCVEVEELTEEQELYILQYWLSQNDFDREHLCPATIIDFLYAIPFSCMSRNHHFYNQHPICQKIFPNLNEDIKNPKIITTNCCPCYTYGIEEVTKKVEEYLKQHLCRHENL